MGLYAFGELFVFVAILMLGLVYVWLKGDLEWIRTVRGATEPLLVQKSFAGEVSRPRPAKVPTPALAAEAGAPHA
jgi:hypothetical protein